MHPKGLRIEEYDYQLPEGKIAKFPLANRDDSKLLYYESGNLSDHVFRELPEILPADSLLVFNNTQVVQARLQFTTDNDKKIEIFCLQPADTDKDISLALATTGGVEWICMIGGNRKWKSGKHEIKLLIGSESVTINVERLENRGGVFVVRFEWYPGSISFAEILDHAGVTPLPPYLKRQAVESDKSRYQTIYAQFAGSVAAPTAGLHFTKNVIKRLREKAIQMQEVTLHVGAGTFKPVTSEKLEDHEMHYEFIDVSVSFLKSLLSSQSKRIIPVGTTSMRTIESLYWMGVKALYEDRPLTPPELEITQWFPYEIETETSLTESLEALIRNLELQGLDRIITRTQLLIAPSYKPQIANGLITNYHQPKSTLLVLIAALIGDDWEKVYKHALSNNYRFLSYGDSSLLLF